MKVEILVTDGGPHSPQKWALATARQILTSVFADDETSDTRKFEVGLLDILSPHHAKVQEHERGKIKEHGMDRLSHSIDPRPHCSDPVAEIAALAATMGTVQITDPDDPAKMKAVDLGAHFARPEVQAAISGLIGAHFASAMDIERSWHADRNAQHPEAIAYRQARTNHSAAHVHTTIQKYRTKAKG